MIVTILFVLSMISERIATFLKLQLPEKGIRLFKVNFLNPRVYRTKQKAKNLEQIRERNVLKLALISGFITSLAIKANLIEILQSSDCTSCLGWRDRSIFNYDLWEAIKLLIGCFLTAIFISMGSKFWHDLLDIIYEIKNAKRVLNDPETKNIDNINSLVTALKTYQSDFIRVAYSKASSELMLLPAVKAVALKNDSDGTGYFEVKVDKLDNNIPPYYTYILSDGTSQSVPIKIYLLKDNDKIVAHSIDLSSEIFGKDFPTKTGTFGCLVKSRENDLSNKNFVLTCCHNLIHPVTNAALFNSLTLKAGVPDVQLNTIGKICFAERTHETDMALVELDAGKIDNIINSLPELGEPSGIRNLNDSDEGRTNASIYGATSGMQTGIITSINCAVEIEYSTDKFQIINLIEIKNNEMSISQEGDSGAVVIDDNNAVIGLVVAGDSSSTYVIPIEKMLKRKNLKLINDQNN